ncbi:MAG: hypothetical protein GWN30_27185 [Gammaproteobacteria bacterium]|nr:hypothetical protein [Gammaproteobacteria bacterium]
MVRYIVAAAPFLQVEDIPTSCKLAVNQTMVPGLNYGDFLTGITLGGTVEGSSVCSQSVEITIPDEPLVEEYDRCFTFSQKQYGLTLLDIPAGSSALTTYVSMSGGVPGLEVDIPEDSNPWEYSAVLGEVQAANCNFPGYAERLYCTFGLPANYMYSLRPLSVYVNGCEAPIFSHPAVSIIPEEAESTGGGGSSDSCVKPPHPDPQNGCWIWIEEECKWECYN